MVASVATQDIHPEGADQREELADEARRSRQPDIGEREHHEGRGIERHAVDETAIGGDLARMHAVIDHADAQEQGRRHDAVGDHLEDAARHALGRRGENAHGDEAHMRDRGIGDELLHVLLHQRHQRGVDHRDDGEREDERGKIVRGRREHRQREAQEAVAAHLQQDGGKDDRARGRRLDMGVGQPGVHRPHRQLHREGGKERQPCPGLQPARKVVAQGAPEYRSCRHSNTSP